MRCVTDLTWTCRLTVKEMKQNRHRGVLHQIRRGPCLTKIHIRASLLAAGAAILFASPAQAQDDAAALRAELAAMRAQMEAMDSRMDALQARLAEAELKNADAKATALAAQGAADAAAEAADAGPRGIAWKGAPKIEGEGGWSFKPRGRLQYDAGYVSSPDGIEDDGLGFANEARRIRLGVEGDIPGGFGYKFEADFTGSSEVEVTDAILTYDAGPLGLTVGQHNNFQSLEELTSSRFNSFMERAAFTDAFGFERRVGLSAQYKRGAVLVQAGAFTDDLESLNDDENGSLGGDVRAVFAPMLGDMQLHLGASAHYRDLGNTISTARYRQRPALHVTDTRFIDTGSFGASSETGYGLEAAAIAGPLHFAGETFWQNVGAPGLSDPTFFGGYAEVGYFLTRGDSRGYKLGVFDRSKPANAVGDGGFGALQINARYDRLDLNDAGIVGGTQDGYNLSLIWTLTPYVRTMINYAHLVYGDAAIPAAGGDRDYSVDAVGMRAEIDF